MPGSPIPHTLAAACGRSAPQKDPKNSQRHARRKRPSFDLFYHFCFLLGAEDFHNIRTIDKPPACHAQNTCKNTCKKKPRKKSNHSKPVGHLLVGNDEQLKQFPDQKRCRNRTQKSQKRRYCCHNGKFPEKKFFQLSLFRSKSH